MKLLFINVENYHGFSQYIAEELKKLGHEVVIFDKLRSAVGEMSLQSLIPNMNYHVNKGNPLSLANFLKFVRPIVGELDYDLIFLEQALIYWDNDVDIPVVYYHRDIWSECFMKNPDMLLYRFKKHRDSLRYISRRTWGMTRWKLRFLNGVHLPRFKPNRRKDFKGLNFISTRIPFKNYMKMDLVQADYYRHVYRMMETMKKKGIATVHDYEKMEFPEYKEVLERCEAVVTIHGKDAPVTRRAYETAACRGIMVLWLQNDESKRTYEEIGLKHGYNCLMFRKVNQLPQIWKVCNNRKAIAQKGFEWVQNRHTYEVRAKELEKVFEDFLREFHAVKPCPQCGKEMTMSDGYFSDCCRLNRDQILAMDKGLMNRQDKEVAAEEIIVRELQKIKEGK